MAIFLTTLTVFLQPIALTVSLVYVYGALGRWRNSEQSRNLVLGVLFGFGTIISMNAPITLADGMIFDLRNLLVGLAIAFLGPVAGLVTLVIGCVTRLLIGGQGAAIGVAAMCATAGMAVLWHYSVRHRMGTSNASLIVLGVFISAHVLVGVLLPAPIRDVFFRDIVPLLLVINIVCSWALGRMIIREQLLRTELTDLREAAETDPLTNLLNRRSLVEVVERLQTSGAAREGKVLLYFDVDRFKSINDTHGHLAGDQVLQTISKRIQHCLRPGDVFARLGGDEFVVVLPKVSPGTARIVAERCRNAVCDAPILIEGKAIDASISMGATYSDGTATFDRLLSAADGALYEAKDAGRNRVTLDQSFKAGNLSAA